MDLAALFRPITAVAFDKDGTLVDFHQTWDPAVAVAIEAVCDTAEQCEGLAAAIGYDLVAHAVVPGSPFVAESVETVDVLVEPWADPRRFEDAVVAEGAKAVVAEPGAIDCIRELHAAGVPLAVVTNDSEVSARAQFEALGWSEYFSEVLGYDSGYGAKPAPGMIEAAAERLGVTAASLAVVGDSSTDIDSARAAGALAVLYGGSTDRSLIERSDAAISSLETLSAAVVAP